jgi:hypothetical protein
MAVGSGIPPPTGGVAPVWAARTSWRLSEPASGRATLPGFAFFGGPW